MRRLTFGEVAFLVGIATFALQRGYSMTGNPTSWLGATIWFLIAAVLVVVGVWYWDKSASRHWGWKLLVSIAVVAVMVVLSYGPIVEQYRREHQTDLGATASKTLSASDIAAEVAKRIPIQPQMVPPSPQSETSPRYMTLELAPWALLWREHDKDPNGRDVYGTKYGIAAILRAHNISNSVQYVRALEVLGDASAEYQLYKMHFGEEGHPPGYLEKDYRTRKPFYQLSWVVWPSGDGRVEQREEKFMRFMIADPSDSLGLENAFNALSTLVGDARAYYGFRDTNTRPRALIRIPSIWLLVHFTGGSPNAVSGHMQFRGPKLNPDVLSGRIQIRVRMDSGRVVLPPQSIRPVMDGDYASWNQRAPQDLFFARGGWERIIPLAKDPAMQMQK